MHSFIPLPSSMAYTPQGISTLPFKSLGYLRNVLAASLNSTRKTPVSTSTVKRRLRDAGLLGRVVKKKTYLRLKRID